MDEAKYRHEYKYLVSAAQLAILQVRADALMQKDPHVDTTGKYSGCYNIRSVYFDDIDNTAYYEIENSEDPREKFRIRIYNHSDKQITLELKSKKAGRCYKDSCPLTREQAEVLLSGKTLPIESDTPYLLKKMMVQMQTRLLHPVVIVEYERIPYTCPFGNTRVTMDLHLRSSCQFNRFFEEILLMRPVLHTGQNMLEIKWDELIPDYIYQSMMLENLQWDSFSKFYYCRRFMAGESNSYEFRK